MKIVDIKMGRLAIPLKKPFKTALRSVDAIDDILVKVITDCGKVGYGEAPPTAVITGDTTGSISYAVENVIAKQLIGMEIENTEAIMERLDSCMVKNTSAKAAVDIAVYDLLGQLYGAPLFRLWGGYRNELRTDITISVNEPEQMMKDSLEAAALGYDTLKIKVGKDSTKDIERIKAIRKAVGYGVALRIDANQGWKPKEAVRALHKMEDEGLDIELVEQPVAAHDVEGLKHVTDNVAIPVMADESMFSPLDALKIMQMRAADLVNIKLMKTGGIHNALKICAMAEVNGIECMMGCMLEGKISVTAAAHLAAAKRVITKIDLDGPSLCSADPIIGGALFDEYQIRIGEEPGFGFQQIRGCFEE
ncbi:MAG TPA: dipeptide epimerase [Firmicutes bacterium]|jgi:L-Ala-D/L-Glu epimerase|nr:dipeptide epimerase [Bacillota bacterium]